MDINVQDLKKRIDAGDENFILIDVREPHEHAASNIGGISIPMASIGQNLSHLSQSKDAEVIVYCQSGNRSKMIKGFLEVQGFSNVRNLMGGMKAWIKMD